jgi:hypothetical protein
METCYAHRTPWYCFDFGIVLSTHTLSRQHELRQGGYRSLPATNLTPSRLYRLSGHGTGLPFVIEGIKEKTSRVHGPLRSLAVASILDNADYPEIDLP